MEQGEYTSDQYQFCLVYNGGPVRELARMKSLKRKKKVVTSGDI